MDAKNKLNSSLGLGETKKNKQLLYASGAQQSVLTFLGQSAKNQTSRSERPPKQKRIYHITTWKADIYIYIYSQLSAYIHISSYPTSFCWKPYNPGSSNSSASKWLFKVLGRQKFAYSNTRGPVFKRHIHKPHIVNEAKASPKGW